MRIKPFDFGWKYLGWYGWQTKYSISFVIIIWRFEIEFEYRKGY